MPREEIEMDQPVERLSVLDEDGSVDAELLPDLEEETLLRMHRTMLLSRRFDEKRLEWQRGGRIGTFAPATGQEAAQVGAAAALEEDDWMVQSYREVAANLWRGTPMSGMIVYDAGFNEGGHVPEPRRDTPISIPVGSQPTHAAGIGYASRLRDTGEVALTFFGDGATSEGDVHEAMNFAEVFDTPTVFFCQNNQWAISVPRERQTRSKTLAQKALAYGMPGLQVDGNDVFAVYRGVAEAVERARRGDGPTLVEAVTYRLSMHTTADDPSKYRSEEEVEEWEERDPLPRFQGWLKSEGLLTDEDVEEIEAEIEEEIAEAWEEAESRMEEMDDPEAMFDHVWAEAPPRLREQREAFLESSAADTEVGHG